MKLYLLIVALVLLIIQVILVILTIRASNRTRKIFEKYKEKYGK